MQVSVLFDIIVLLHGLTISADCVMLIENKMKFYYNMLHVDVRELYSWVHKVHSISTFIAWRRGAGKSIFNLIAAPTEI